MRFFIFPGAVTTRAGTIHPTRLRVVGILVAVLCFSAACDLGLSRPVFPEGESVDAGGTGSGTGAGDDTGGADNGAAGTVLLQAGAGAMVLRHGDFLYCLGGEDAAGQPTAAVRALRLGTSGEPAGDWFDVAPLPVPVRDGAAFGLGHFIHVIGGFDPEGIPTATIWYAYADPTDGRLGFGGTDVWSRHSRPLPEGRADAAWAIHDGRLFLAGGQTSGGLAEDILHAAVYRDGYLGFWHRSRETLPVPVRGAGAVVMIDEPVDVATLVIAGGKGTAGLLSEGRAFRIGPWGLLSEPRDFLLPTALYRPVLVPGWDAPVLDGLAGPGHAVAAGRLLALAQDATLRSIAASMDPEAPPVLPGSGIVPAGTYVRIRPEPGTVLRYRVSTDGPVASVGPEDPLWQPGFRLSSSVHMAFRAFHADGRASALVRRSYQVGSTSMFLHTEPLPIRPLEDADLRGLSPGWYYFILNEPSLLTFFWEDAPAAEHPSAALVSVFEPDLCSPVPDAEGVMGVLGLQASASPVRLRLPAGTFYLQVQAPASKPTHPGILAALVRDGD